MITPPKRMLGYRAPGWKYNMPGPNDNPSIYPCPAVLPYAPNHIDDIYMELPHSTLKARGLSAWTAVLTVAVLIFLAIVWVFFLAEFGPTLFSFHYPILLVLGGWMATYTWRMDVEAPVDEPIRFNRARRKIYIYRFHHDGLKPFSRKDWGVQPVAYEWDQITAEFCSVYGPMGTGGLVESIMLSVRQPHTQKVIDRFVFAQDKQEAEMYWAMAQLYMQQGPDAIPRFSKPPRDWNNESHFENIARRLAPKVKWPEAMDIESRTAG